MIYSRKIKWKLLLSITGNEYQRNLFRTGIKASPSIEQRKPVALPVGCMCKYVKQKTLDEMLQELPGAGQFIIVMDTWFERLMADQ